MGGFADLISPYFTGHSAGVAELAAAAARRCRVDAAGAGAVRRAALVHDLADIRGLYARAEASTANHARQAYQDGAAGAFGSVLGAADRLKAVHPDSAHEFPDAERKLSYDFIDRVLKPSDDAAP